MGVYWIDVELRDHYLGELDLTIQVETDDKSDIVREDVLEGIEEYPKLRRCNFSNIKINQIQEVTKLDDSIIEMMKE